MLKIRLLKPSNRTQCTFSFIYFSLFIFLWLGTFFTSSAQIQGLPTKPICNGSYVTVYDNSTNAFSSWTFVGLSISNSLNKQETFQVTDNGKFSVMLFSGTSSVSGTLYSSEITVVGTTITPSTLTYDNGATEKVCFSFLKSIKPILTPITTFTGNYFTPINYNNAGLIPSRGFNTLTGILTNAGNNLAPTDGNYNIFYSYPITLSGIACMVNTSIASINIEFIPYFSYSVVNNSGGFSNNTPFNYGFALDGGGVNPLLPSGYNTNPNNCNKQIIDFNTVNTNVDLPNLLVNWQYSRNPTDPDAWKSMPGTSPRWDSNIGSLSYYKGYAIGYTNGNPLNTNSNDFPINYGDSTLYFRALNSYRTSAGGVCTNVPTSSAYIAYSISGIATAGTIVGVNNNYGLNSTNSGTNVSVCLNDVVTLSLTGFWGTAYWQRGIITNTGIRWTLEPTVAGQTLFRNGGNVFPNFDYHKNSSITANPAIHVRDFATNTKYDYNQDSATQNGVASLIPRITATGTYLFRVGVTYNQTIMNDGRFSNSPGPCSTIPSNVITVTAYNCSLKASIQNPYSSPGICFSDVSSGILLTPQTTLVGDNISFIQNYIWDLGNGALPKRVSSESPDIPEFTYISAGLKTIILTVVGSNSMSVTTTTIDVSDVSKVNATVLQSNYLNTICGGNLVNLSITGVNRINNPNLYAPNIAWFTSLAGNNINSISGLSIQNVTIPNTEVIYFAKVTNGVCPAKTTDNLYIKGLPPLNAFPNKDTTLVLCEGLKADLKVRSNFGTDIIFKYTESPSNAFSNNLVNVTVDGTSLGYNLGLGFYQTRNFTIAGNHFFKADVSNPFTCNATSTGIFIVSVVSCPITPTILTSAVGLAFTNQACLNNDALFNIRDITPTFTGVTIDKWQWNISSVGTNVNDAAITDAVYTTTSSFQNTFQNEGIKVVSLTVSGMAGTKPYIGFAQTTLTVDGISSITGFGSDIPDNLLCINSNAVLLLTAPKQSNAVVSWIDGSTNMVLATTLGVNGSNNFSYTISGYNSPRQLIYTASVKNGVCPKFTLAERIFVTVTSAPITSLTSPLNVDICRGQQTLVSLTGQNIYKSYFQKADNNGVFVVQDTRTTINTVNNTTTKPVFSTENLTAIGTYFYRVVVDGAKGCESASTYNVTVNSLPCDFQPTITISSRSNRICFDAANNLNNVVNFESSIPTYKGITNITYNWDFADNYVTTGGYPQGANTKSPNVLYAQSTDNPIRNISLTVTGISGISTLVGINSYTITIDGIPTISGFSYFGSGGNKFFTDNPGNGFCINLNTNKAGNTSDAITLAFD